MHAIPSLPLLFGHRARSLALRAACLCICFCGTALLGQTVRPVVDDNIVKAPGKKASGRIEYVNDSLQALTVTLEMQSYTVSDTGEMIYRPLDPNIHVKLSAMSFRIPPRQSYLLFYEAYADTLPTWFVIYATFAGFKERTPEGFNIQIMLPHTVYLLPKAEVRRNDLIIKDAEYHPDTKKVLVTVENTGPAFGRILDADISSGMDKIVMNGFPVFPHRQRQVEYPWDAKSEPKKLTLHLQRFQLEQPIGNTVP